MVALCQAQTTGVYITAEDFKANRPSYPILCQKGEGSVKIKASSIIVADKKGKHKFDKKSVFAVRTCKNTFRIWGNDEYRIINSEEMYLYSRLISLGGEGAFYEEKFFFSLEADSEIIPLTKEELKNAFPENAKFHKSINGSFRNNADLGLFNKHLRVYMIIYFYKQSLR